MAIALEAWFGEQFLVRKYSPEERDIHQKAYDVLAGQFAELRSVARELWFFAEHAEDDKLAQLVQFMTSGNWLELNDIFGIDEWGEADAGITLYKLQFWLACRILNRAPHMSRALLHAIFAAEPEGHAWWAGWTGLAQWQALFEEFPDDDGIAGVRAWFDQ